ncbi:MAG: DNA translocase FtsK 4TM domain-containing protein [Hyphomicrobiales bacterium]
MALHEAYDTDEGAIPEALRRFMRNRAYELCGLLILAGVSFASLSLASWSASDPSFDHATSEAPRNWLGYPGAVVSDLLAHIILAWRASPFLLVPWPGPTVSCATATSTMCCSFFYTGSPVPWSLAVALAVIPVSAPWPLTVGLGGQLGDSLFRLGGGNIEPCLKPLLSAFLVAGAAALQRPGASPAQSVFRPRSPRRSQHVWPLCRKPGPPLHARSNGGPWRSPPPWGQA